jgi:hypothetical protein
MTAQVIAIKPEVKIKDIKPQSVNELTKQAKATWDRADQKAADADEWYIRTGKILVELKGRTKHGEWLISLKKIGRSQQRASELMALSDGGLDTLKQQRQRKRDTWHRMQKKKSLLASGGLDTNDEGFDNQEAGDTLEEQWQFSLSNLCGDILARQSYWNTQFKGWEKFNCPPHIKTLMKEAAAEFASIITNVTKR